MTDKHQRKKGGEKASHKSIDTIPSLDETVPDGSVSEQQQEWLQALALSASVAGLPHAASIEHSLWCVRGAGQRLSTKHVGTATAGHRKTQRSANRMPWRDRGFPRPQGLPTQFSGSPLLD